MFVARSNGEISGCFACAQYVGQEELPDDADEIGAFRKRISDRIAVSRLRLKLELAERGLLAAVEAAVSAAGAIPQLYWAEAATYESDHPLALQIGGALKLSPSEIRALFKAASQRNA